MKNLVDAEPERASQMAYALHSWVQSLPAGPSWLPNQGCPGFRFPTGGNPSMGAGGIAATELQAAEEAAHGGAQDSTPDW